MKSHQVKLNNILFQILLVVLVLKIIIAQVWCLVIHLKIWSVFYPTKATSVDWQSKPLNAVCVSVWGVVQNQVYEILKILTIFLS